MKQKKEPTKKKKSKIRSTIEWILTGIFVAILGVMSTFQIYGVTHKVQYGTQTALNYFGYHLFQVKTDSMANKYPVGSFVVVHLITEYDQIEKGDDVSFVYDIDGNGTEEIVTHQIRHEDGITIKEVNGVKTYTFRASGINKHSENCKNDKGEPGDCTYQYQEFTQDKLIGKVVGKSLFLGYLFAFITQWYGMLVVLLIPALYLIVSSIIDIVKALKDTDEDDDSGPKKKKKDDGPTVDENGKRILSDEDKERLKKELLNELLEKKGSK